MNIKSRNADMLRLTFRWVSLSVFTLCVRQVDAQVLNRCEAQFVSNRSTLGESNGSDQGMKSEAKWPTYWSSVWTPKSLFHPGGYTMRAKYLYTGLDVIGSSPAHTPVRIELNGEGVAILHNKYDPLLVIENGGPARRYTRFVPYHLSFGAFYSTKAVPEKLFNGERVESYGEDPEKWNPRQRDQFVNYLGRLEKSVGMSMRGILSVSETKFFLKTDSGMVHTLDKETVHHRKIDAISSGTGNIVQTKIDEMKAPVRISFGTLGDFIIRNDGVAFAWFVDPESKAYARQIFQILPRPSDARDDSPIDPKLENVQLLSFQLESGRLTLTFSDPSGSPTVSKKYLLFGKETIHNPTTNVVISRDSLLRDVPEYLLGSYHSPVYIGRTQSPGRLGNGEPDPYYTPDLQGESYYGVPVR